MWWEFCTHSLGLGMGFCNECMLACIYKSQNHYKHNIRLSGSPAPQRLTSTNSLEMHQGHEIIWMPIIYTKLGITTTQQQTPLLRQILYHSSHPCSVAEKFCWLSIVMVRHDGGEMIQVPVLAKQGFIGATEGKGRILKQRNYEGSKQNRN